MTGNGYGDSVHVLLIEPAGWTWDLPPPSWRSTSTQRDNTEREVHVPPECPTVYKTLADSLANDIRSSTEPPTTHSFPRGRSKEDSFLVQTTSGHPIAIRTSRKGRKQNKEDPNQVFVTLVLPRVSNLSEWFHAFLTDIDGIDKDRVPHAPPRLSTPSDWYTPKERNLARRIGNITSRVKELTDERDRIEGALRSETEMADKNDGDRVLWSQLTWISGAMVRLLLWFLLVFDGGAHFQCGVVPVAVVEDL